MKEYIDVILVKENEDKIIKNVEVFDLKDLIKIIKKDMKKYNWDFQEIESVKDWIYEYMNENAMYTFDEIENITEIIEEMQEYLREEKAKQPSLDKYGRVYISKEIREKAEINERDELDIFINNTGDIIIRKISLEDRIYKLLNEISEYLDELEDRPENLIDRIDDILPEIEIM